MELVLEGMQILFSLHASYDNYNISVDIWLVKALMQYMLS